jgi:hypothetical protein
MLSLETGVKPLMYVSRHFVDERLDLLPKQQTCMRIVSGPWCQVSPGIVNARAESFKNNIGSAAASAAMVLLRNDYMDPKNMATWHTLGHISSIGPKNNNQLTSALEHLKLHHVSLIPICFPELTL